MISGRRQEQTRKQHQRSSQDESTTTASPPTTTTNRRRIYHSLLHWMIPLSVITSLGMSWRSSHSYNHNNIHDIDGNYHDHQHNSNDGHDHDAPWSYSSSAAAATVSTNSSGGSGGGSMTMPFVDPSSSATTTSSTLSSWWYSNNNNHDDDPDEDEMTTSTVTTTPTATTTTTSITDTTTWIMVAPPDFTTHVVPPNETKRATEYYRSNLNEERGEIWLHRGFVRLQQKKQLEEKEEGRRRRLDEEENDNERRRRKRRRRLQQQLEEEHSPSTVNPNQTRTDTRIDAHDENDNDRPQQVSAILIAGYFHLKWGLQTKEEQKNKENKVNYHHTLVSTYKQHLEELYKDDPTMKTLPHLLLIPSWNPGVARDIGICALVDMVRKDIGIEEHLLWSVGFERNRFWQGQLIMEDKILPIPYVVEPVITLQQQKQQDEEKEWNSSPPYPSNHDNKNTRNIDTTIENSVVDLQQLPKDQPRRSNFVFYSGDPRPNAKVWAGCHRDVMLGPLMEYSNNNSSSNGSTPDNTTTITTTIAEGSLQMDVRLVSNRAKQGLHLAPRLNQQEYNHRMVTSDYCLIVCGDTPTSRSLASAMIYGCIPLFLGSRWKGLCEPPCKAKWGFKVTGMDYPHWPYSDKIPWDEFPELKEERFMELHGIEDLVELFQTVNEEQKLKLRSIMESTWKGWIYGWGDPWTSDQFGDATEYTWESFQNHLLLQQDERY